MSLKRTHSLSRGIGRVARLRICASRELRQIELGETSRDHFLRRFGLVVALLPIAILQPQNKSFLLEIRNSIRIGYLENIIYLKLRVNTLVVF
jgi:hypothetical protein